MASVEAFIWHDENGSILAVGHVVVGCEERIEPKGRAGQAILTLSLEETQLPSLHLTHVVDVAKGTLCARSTTR
jgi:hypothetical protein